MAGTLSPARAPAESGASGSREKIAILGGGVGAMAAAFSLTEQEGWQERYEITVYQMGWRLGGKGASGRNAAHSDRIEEHGLHVWLGFYENAFRLIQRCYRELDRPPGAPLATWRDAFHPHNFVVFEDRVEQRWRRWGIHYPPNHLVPGEGNVLPTPWEFVTISLRLMLQQLAPGAVLDDRERSPRGARVSREAQGVRGGAGAPAWERALRAAAEDLRDLILDAEGALLRGAYLLARALAPDPRRHSAGDYGRLAALLDRFLGVLWQRLSRRIDEDDTTRHLWIQLDLWATVVKGMLADRLILYGFVAADGEDLKDWLRRHGASELTVQSSSVRSAYDLVFGFAHGEATRPRLAAGTGLLGMLRLALTYRGAIAWKMQAGMGDAVFAPLYAVLRRRGVRFAFFHRAERLHLSPDGGAVEAVCLRRQARVRGGALAYDPLVDVKGLPCWPSAPLYAQLTDGARLRRSGADLESSWSTWRGEPLTLTRGRDFDQLVLGISLGALPRLCPELIRANPAWRDMVRHVQTVRTLAFQFWLRPRLAGLGWRWDSPVLTTYVEPYDTWADMSHLLPRERWPAGDTPGSLHYFCGPLDEPPPDEPPPPPHSDPGYPRRETDKVRQMAATYLRQDVGRLWPDAVRQADGRGFDWDLLVDPGGGAGEERLAAQYFRANVEPSERYVLSLPGSTRYRLRSDRSGFDNLFLAGDWTYTGLNAGCVEAAVMSGMRAAQGICGWPREIVGDPDG